MANSLFSSPTNPHFFKPLLPGFETHLSIPEAFYSKYLEGKEEGNTATLISDASEITWKITVDGPRLTHGWEKFAVAHDLKVGDILVFRHEGNLMFHVTPLGPSYCEILYSHNDDNLNEKLNGNSKVKKKSEIKDETCFVVPVTTSNLGADSLNLPKGFTTSSGVSQLSNEITLMDEKGWSSTIGLVFHRSTDRFCFKRGWRAFCWQNGYKSGDFLRLIVVSNGETPVLRIVSLERDEDRMLNLCLCQMILALTVTNLREIDCIFQGGFQAQLRTKDFTNKQGRTWTLSSGNNKSTGQFCINCGWRRFCEANGRKAGCSFSFKLVRHGTNLVYKRNNLHQNNTGL